MRRAVPILVAFAAVAALVVPYLALGGASYEPTAVADPCSTREWRNPVDVQQVAEQIVLSGLDGAACKLGVSREELMLGIASNQSLDAFADEHGITRAAAEKAVRAGLVRAVDDAEKANALPAFAATIARVAVAQIPPSRVLDLLEQLPALVGGRR